MRIRGYKVTAKLGKGSFASVYAARRKSDKTPVAIKKVPLNMVHNWAEHEGRLVPEEAALLYKVQHVPGVIKLLECITTEDTIFMVMERVYRSMTIEDYLRTHGPLREKVIKRIFRLLVRTVEGCLNAGVSHKDIKTENVLVFRDRETGALGIRLIDFGCGEFVRGDRGTDTGGTEMYWPPEFLFEGEYLHVPATVWSLGTLLYYMLCRRDAFRTVGDIQKARPKFGHEVPEQCRELLTRCFAQDPEDRPSVEEILSHPWLQKSSSKRHDAKRKRLAEEDLSASTREAEGRKRRRHDDGNRRRRPAEGHKKRRKHGKLSE
ncbi:serine/threonine-protein kinase pim-2-like [Oratosquilla oratoria]|uniref:serine/threonine-protein kinase pim-2-like n=1 Tax=Oratosquilla oratoria TaxID=337810 RepID=UPI003F76904A